MSVHPMDLQTAQVCGSQAARGGRQGLASGAGTTLSWGLKKLELSLAGKWWPRPLGHAAHPGAAVRLTSSH